MKKIIAFSVLLVLLSAAVFAQDGSGWKIGFWAQYFQDLVFTTKATGKYENDPAGGGTTTTEELGKYIKGQTDFFGITAQEDTHNRMLLSLSNDGEHHHFYIDLQYEGWESGAKLWTLLNSGAGDWYFSGDTGASGSAIVLDAKVGTGRYDGWVNRIDVWSDWIGAGAENFFGVREYNDSPKGRFYTSNTVGAVKKSTNPWDEHQPWDPVFAVGVTYDNKFRLALGSLLSTPDSSEPYGDPYSSQSNTKFSTILSGRPVDLLTFDVFYSVNGSDKNTAARGTNGEWDNIIGAYVGLDLGTVGISGLGVSAGYTANFIAYEKQVAWDGTSEKPFDKTGPVWSGIDLNVQYNGIDKLGLALKNNISFASAEYKYFKNTWDGELVDLTGGSFNVNGKDDSETQNWFAYRARLSASYGLTDNLSVGLHLQDVLTVYSTSEEVVVANVKATDKTTTNVLTTSLYAKYGVGNVSFALGLTLGIDSTSEETTTKNSTGTGKTTKNLDITRFHVPVVFKVSL